MSNLHNFQVSKKKKKIKSKQHVNKGMLKQNKMSQIVVNTLYY